MLNAVRVQSFVWLSAGPAGESLSHTEQGIASPLLRSLLEVPSVLGARQTSFKKDFRVCVCVCVYMFYMVQVPLEVRREH